MHSVQEGIVHRENAENRKYKDLQNQYIMGTIRFERHFILLFFPNLYFTDTGKKAQCGYMQ